MTDQFHCPLCGGSSYQHVMDLRDRVMRTMEDSFRLVRCTGCGLMRLHPLPDSVTLARSYTVDYAPHRRSGASGWAKSVLDRRSVRRLQGYLEPPKRVLDVGCATGDLLVAVRASGNPRVTGVEPGEVASRVARKRGLNVITGDLASAGLPDRSFDTVLISHTLEHVEDPIMFLAEVNKVLEPGGTLLIWIPNVDSIEADVFRRFWIGYDVPRHLTTFSTDTLGRALAVSGYRVEDIRHEAVGLEWAWGLRLAVREYLPLADRALARVHPLLIVVFTPLAFLSSRMRRSGRIMVIARKV